MTATRYGIFVHDPDGDMGYGMLVGQFRGDDAAGRADACAELIRRAGDKAGREIEAIVLPMHGSAYPVAKIVDELLGD
jgi:hypothetical protein